MQTHLHCYRISNPNNLKIQIHQILHNFLYYQISFIIKNATCTSTSKGMTSIMRVSIGQGSLIASVRFKSYFKLLLFNNAIIGQSTGVNSPFSSFPVLNLFNIYFGAVANTTEFYCVLVMKCSNTHIRHVLGIYVKSRVKDKYRENCENRKNCEELEPFPYVYCSSRGLCARFLENCFSSSSFFFSLSLSLPRSPSRCRRRVHTLAPIGGPRERRI